MGRLLASSGVKLAIVDVFDDVAEEDEGEGGNRTFQGPTPNAPNPSCLPCTADASFSTSSISPSSCPRDGLFVKSRESLAAAWTNEPPSMGMPFWSAVGLLLGGDFGDLGALPVRLTGKGKEFEKEGRSRGSSGRSFCTSGRSFWTSGRSFWTSGRFLSTPVPEGSWRRLMEFHEELEADEIKDC